MTLPENWQIRLIQLLALPGVVVAYYLWLFHNGTLMTTCGVNDLFDCGQVSGPTAPYASIGPIPVALIGMIGYITIFLLAWLQDWVHFIDDYMPELMIAVVGMAFLITLGLTLLEFFVIHAFCQYCLISAGIVLVMFILAIMYLRSSRKA